MFSTTGTGAGADRVPADFWRRDQARAAAARLDLTTVMRLLLRHTNLTQADVAHLAHLSTAAVSRDVNGRQPVSGIGRIRQALAGLGAPGYDEAAESGVPDQAGESPGRPVLESLEHRARALIHQTEQIAAGSVALADERLRGAAARYLSDPAAYVLPDLCEISEQVQAWRDLRLPPRQARDVWILSGWHAVLVGWICVDLGRPDLAATHARAAQVCADQSGHDGVAAWTAVVRRALSYWQMRRRRGAQQVAAAVEAARRVGGGAEVMVLSALAQDQAHLGEQQHAATLLEQARYALERGEPTDDSDLAGPLTGSAARACEYWAETYLSLEEPVRALECARQGLAAAQEQMVPSPTVECVLMLHMALAYARLGQVEKAAAVVEPVFEVPVALRTQPLVLRLQRAGRALPVLKERIAAFARSWESSAVTWVDIRQLSP